MTKRKIVTLALVAVIALTSIAGATMAYFTDLHGHDVNNVFTIGDGIKIDLFEKIGINDNTVETNREGYTYENVQPTDTLVKVPTIKNTGSNAAYVRVAVVINNVQAINDAIDNVYENIDGYDADDIQNIYDGIFDGWGVNYAKRDGQKGEVGRRLWMDSRTGHQDSADEASPVLCNIDSYARVNDDYGMYDIENAFQSEDEKELIKTYNNLDGIVYCDQGQTSYYGAAVNSDERVYVFYLELDAGESYELFNGLNVPADFTNEQMEMFNDLHIDVYADAIQVAGFETYTDAFTQLETEHPIGWWNNTDAQA